MYTTYRYTLVLYRCTLYALVHSGFKFRALLFLFTLKKLKHCLLAYCKTICREMWEVSPVHTKIYKQVKELYGGRLYGLSNANKAKWILPYELKLTCLAEFLRNKRRSTICNASIQPHMNTERVVRSSEVFFLHIEKLKLLYENESLALHDNAGFLQWF